MKTLSGLLLLWLFACCSTGTKEKEVKGSVSEGANNDPKIIKQEPINYIKILADNNYQSNNYALAIEQYSQLVGGDSLNGEYFYKRGFCYAKLNDFKHSASDLKKAIRFRYRVDAAYRLLGMYELASLNDSVAIYYFKKSLEVNPNDPNTLDALKTCEKALRDKANKKANKLEY
jgi:tetratricopeptide (TPR) repeat protein